MRRYSGRHCIGFDVVEYPATHDEAREELKPGMVFAVENGAYHYGLENLFSMAPPNVLEKLYLPKAL